ncbi:hypothetical protein ACA910_010510 [Epithemia clementina (nom. ined.)]
MTELLEQIRAMLMQEVAAYGTVDYLAPSFQQNLAYYRAEEETDSSCDPPVPSTSTSVDSSSSGITELWREKICEWSYQVIDHFDFSREVVAIAMNYLDRYLATKFANKKIFQLAAMTALFLAVKLHERSKLSMSSMIELSRGSFNLEQMVVMEISLIRGLRWHLHPPTAQSFVQRFLLLVPSTAISPDALYDVLELSRFLTELSVIDYFFVTQRPSHIGLAALLNAMQDIAAVSIEVQSEFVDLVKKEYKMEIDSLPSVIECRGRLRSLCALQGINGASSTDSSSYRGAGVSPVCVSYGTLRAQTIVKDQGSIVT